MGRILTLNRQPERGSEHLRTASRLSPRDPLTGVIQYSLGQSYFAMEDYSACIDWITKGLRSYPEGTNAIPVLFSALALLGQDEELAKVKQLYMSRIEDLKIDDLRTKFSHLGSIFVEGLRKTRMLEN